ncbi:hypothetical protein [Marinobacterium lacunae]|nr:hypothetical protein [Marinobacterium lacunae]
MVCKDDLNALQRKKLTAAASILHRTAHLYDGTQSLLPLWGGGVITHGVPKFKKCIIGITEDAKIAKKEDRTSDHLYRVTETAKYVLSKIVEDDLDVSAIEDVLLARSALMITTRSENNKKLKDALKQCENKDSWQELYEKAGIKYELY